MGSNSGKGKHQGRGLRLGAKGRRVGFLRLESLEGRVLLATSPWQPSNNNLADIQAGPMANAGQDLINVYQAYLSSGDNAAQAESQYPQFQYQGSSIGIDTNWSGSGDFGAYQTALNNLGMSITATSASSGLVEGYLPIAELPTVAQEPQTLDLRAIAQPVTYFQGLANNEADQSLKADLARQSFGVSGAGVTVGVISNSVNQAPNPGGRPAGVAGSIQSGDLPASGVNILRDGPAGSDDEGRAMLENIHDIAPGASLDFASAISNGLLGDASFAQAVQMLQAAGAKVIVDDLVGPNDPWFQDGLVAQAINNFTSHGGIYFSAAGNGANQGYLSNFRPTTATITAIGTGTFMNFNPNGGVTTQLPITVLPNAGGFQLEMQFDQPFNPEEPAGSSATVTSEVDFYLLDSTNAVVASGTSNNVATQQPTQTLTFPANIAAGNYTIAIFVRSGPNPGHVEFTLSPANGSAITVPQTFGNAGGTFYPTSTGHQTAPANIAVGAVPWWATTPFLGQSPLASEPFSSTGPGLSVFNPDGTRKSSPVIVQAPGVSGADGGNTSFFQPGVIIDTSKPPTPGQPATSTNLSQNLPSFFGTSSASPNIAAVAALMLQVNPSLNQGQVRSALIGSAQPLNGSAPGTWDTKGGFGIVNAQAALTAVNSLRVLTSTPSNGQVATLSPATITLTLNRAVNFSTVSASDLSFTALPPGVSMTVGTPIAVDNPQFPTVIAFPINISTPPGTLANGSYSYIFQGSVTGEDGSALIPYSGSFTLQASNGPQIIGTSLSGRVISIQFNEGLQPGSINSNTFQIWRAGGVNNSFGQPGTVPVFQDPRTQYIYNPLTNTVSIDLTNLDQSQLPTDQYAIVVHAGENGTAAAVNQAGLPLDGEFNGFFPTGNGVPGGAFFQNLGVLTLGPPTVSGIKMDPGSDTGIAGDENTNSTTPVFDGQVSTSFPGTLANLTVLAEFNSLHGGNLDLAPGPNGRGFVGSFDAMTHTDASGHFSFQAPTLLEGYQLVRVLVVGAPDIPPQAGLSSSIDHSFRIDTTAPSIGLPTTTTPGVPLNAVSLTPGGTPLPLAGTNLASLGALSLNVVDFPNPATGALATPAALLLPALDPTTADNLGNYQLINTTTGVDESTFISSAIFTATDTTFAAGSTPKRNTTSDPFAGRIDLTFRVGLPAGTYQLIVHSGPTANASGLQDAAGNPMNNTAALGNPDFRFSFNLQSQPVYITNLGLQNSYGQANSTLIGGPRSYFQVPAANADTRAPAPPTTVVVDFSAPLNPTANYSNAIQLIGSANGSGAAPDGNFGTLGVGGTGSSGTGFTRVAGTTVTLVDPTGKLPGAPGFSGTRLVLQLAPNTTLPADSYRIYMPNTGASAIFDIFGNQLDGEFLGNLAQSGNNYVANASFDGYTSSATTATGNYQPPVYQDLIANDILNGVSQYRMNDLSGDGVAGGAFTTGFTVVPSGNVIYARSDYVENPLNPATYSDGSLAKPYSVLAPQATATAANGGNLNAPVNFTSFNPAFDRAGIGRFATSAFYAASVLAANGPVIIVALPSTPQRDPVTGAITTKTFVLQSPTDGSASVPFDTSLVFDPGTVLKLSNASLFVQNQGSSLQTLGTNSNGNHVIFTSLNDNTAGGANNNNTSSPRGGDWGGIVFRNYNEAANSTTFPVDGTLQGPAGQPAVSGADDIESFVNFTEVRYAGGAVPASQGIRYDAITLYNSRPTLTNDAIIIPNANTAGAQAAISADFDSFREDDNARGPLVRLTAVSNYSLNGIWIRPNLTTGLTGVAEQSNAITYAANPSTLGGATNFTFDATLPYILTSQLLLGDELLVNTGGLTQFVNARLYVEPGVIVKSASGAGISVVNNNASINIGSRTYISQYDANPNFNYQSPNFKSEALGDAPVVFTSLYDAQATTPFIPAPIDSANDAKNPNGAFANQPNINGGAAAVPLVSRWGSVGIQSGAVAVVNDAEFRYGGGSVNGPTATLPSQSVLAFITTQTLLSTPLNSGGGGGFFFNSLFSPLAQLGTHAIVTNNNFFDNFDTAMQIEPNGLLAGDPTRPLSSGNPFFNNNLLQRNDIDGLGVVTSRSYTVSQDRTTLIRPQEIPLANGNFNLTVNSVWDNPSLTYVLRGSIVPAGYYDSGGSAPIPSTVAFQAEQKPFITLTIQSVLPGTTMADGSVVPSPGAPVVVKMLNDYTPFLAGNLGTYGSTGATNLTGASVDGGAGFLVGVDDGIDPPSTTGSPLIDPGAGSQIRILGIAGNSATGQPRVPVILTSLRDNSVGVTVRGTPEFKIYNNDPLFTVQGNANFDPNKAPAAGDAGYIYFGGNSLTNYNPQDPRGGSLIDNADIRYMTSIQLQGGGIVDTSPTAGQSWLQTKLGQTPATQFNSDMALTISDSNLSSFSDAAVFVHPTAANALIRTFGVAGAPPVVARATNPAVKGEGAVLYMLNDTVSNSGVGIQANSETTDATTLPSAIELVLLNNTFYNNPIALHTIAPNSGATIPLNDSVYWLAMDNIFSNSTNTAIISDGQEFGSEGQYNLFWQNAVNAAVNGTNTTAFGGINSSVLANPQFRNPAAGDFSLLANSAAIDASRSEIGPDPAGDAIFPTVTQVLDASGGIRTDPASLTPPATPGRSNAFGGAGAVTDPRKQVTLPGSPNSTFVDQWFPVLPSAPNAVLGPASNAATFAYAPATGSNSGERDILGQFRQDDPNVPNVGFGSRPFFDIGAYEYVQYFPPQVVAFSSTANVQATLPGGTTKDIYTVGSVSGVNQVPQTVQIRFNHQLDASTINDKSVLLVGSGGDGVFGNANDVTFDLAGRLSYSNTSAGSILTINMAGLNLPTDEYEITLEGSGSNVIKDVQGNALDGENTPKDDPNGVQQGLPSGDGLPGGNFYLQFTIDMHAPAIVPGTFHMTAATDSNIVGDQITNDNTPSFTGRITDIFPPSNPLLGDTVFLDVLNLSTGQWQQVGQSTTDAQGNFTVAVSSPLPDTPYNVGPDGIIHTADDTFFDSARVRVVDQAGNASNLFTDPQSAFSAAGALTNFVIDTGSPLLQSVSPAPGALINSGSPTISFTVNKNLDPSSLNANTITVLRAGPGGVIGSPNNVAVPLTGVTFNITPLKNGPQGPEQVSFTLPAGSPNDIYQIDLHGAGSPAITDIAGNPLNGSGARGSDTIWTIVVGVPSAAHILYVGPGFVTSTSAAAGSRANPYPTIGQAITAAGVGDTVAVLPGVYTENVTLKSLVRVISAATSSTDSQVNAGNALQTVIRAPTTPTAPATQNIAVSGANLISVAGLTTELAGFSIVAPLIGNQANGPLDPTSIAVNLINSNVLIDKNYIITGGIGVNIATTGVNAATPSLQDDVIAGNIFGVVINDAGAGSLGAPVTLYNNDIVNNQVGVSLNVNAGSPIMADLGNNIFWENHDLTSARNGAAILASFPNKVTIRGNLFSGNGPSETNPSDDVINAGGGFNPAVLGPTPDQFGNFTGNPAFVAPRDPRPGSDGPGEFFLDANFDLTSASAAIDAALPAVTPTVDFLYRSRVRVPGRGFPGTGPGDVGAFEFDGTGGIPAGGAFRVASTSLAPGGAALAAGSSITLQQINNSVIVDFSGVVDPNSVTASDLVLSGNGLDPSNPAHATGLAWIDPHTVKFLLSGNFNSSGTVQVSIASGTIMNTDHQGLLGFSDSVQIGSASSTATPSNSSPTTTPTSTPTPTQTPAPAATPTAPGHKVKLKHKAQHHPGVKHKPAVRHHTVPNGPLNHKKGA